MSLGNWRIGFVVPRNVVNFVNSIYVCAHDWPAEIKTISGNVDFFFLAFLYSACNGAAR